MAERRPVSILIAALGGQGGGVLTEWLVGAAGHAGYPAQATSIPGVAQRTGATTYYVEVFPERMEAGGARPVFSLHPLAGGGGGVPRGAGRPREPLGEHAAALAAERGDQDRDGAARRHHAGWSQPMTRRRSPSSARDPAPGLCTTRVS